MIEIRDLRKTYRKRGERVVALEVARLDVADGEQVAIVGPSGCGKTTLLHVIAGLLRPDAGTVVVDGTDVFSLPEPRRDRFRAQRIGYVHQTFQLLAGFDALENVVLGAFFAGRQHAEPDARALLERVGLADRARHRPSELSVGQQQRVAVARALVNRPSLLLADEPTGNQDPETALQTLDLMLGLARELGTTVVLVTHDLGVAARLDRTLDLRSLASEPAAVTETNR